MAFGSIIIAGIIALACYVATVPLYEFAKSTTDFLHPAISTKRKTVLYVIMFVAGAGLMLLLSSLIE